MEEAIIRVATGADAETLSGLAATSFTEAFGRLYSGEDLGAFLTKQHSIAAYTSLLADEHSAAWIAEPEDRRRAIGYITATPCGLPAPDMSPRSGEIQRLYILDQWQGGGLGARMMTLALDWMSPRFDEIYISVYAENYDAQRFYERHGFEKVHRYHYMVGEQADPEWIMKQRNA